MADDTWLDERETALLRWRCRRGLVENDLFLERFFTQNGPRILQWKAQALNRLMELPDHDLLDLLLRRTEPADALDTPEITQLLEQIRAQIITTVKETEK